MNKDTLIELKNDAETRYENLVKERDALKGRWDEAVTELGRIQGDYRTLEKLVNEYVEPVEDVTKRKIKE
jgi:hypothetical protein